MTLKNPFALRKADHRIVMIGDLSPEQSGKNCGCVCPVCGADFIANRGNIKAWHFSHKPGSKCDEEKAYINSLHQLMKEGMEEHTRFYYPGCYGRFQESTGEEDFSNTSRLGYETIIEESNFEVESSEIKSDSQGLAEALILTARKGYKLAVVLVPPATVCKNPRPRAVDGIATIAIWVPKNLNRKTSEELQDILLRGTEDKKWLSSQKIDNWKRKCQEERAKRDRRQMDEQARIAEKEAAAARQMADILAEYRASQPAAWDYNNDEELSAIRFHFSKKYAAPTIPRDFIKDPQGEHWCFCNSCKQWYLEADMGLRATDRFDKNPNLGLCSKCARKMQYGK